MEINQEWIDQQRKVCEAATVAPWSWCEDVLTSHWTNVISVLDNEGGASFSLEIDESDRAFIATARTALPAAIDALEASMQREAEKDAEIERLKELSLSELHQLGENLDMTLAGLPAKTFMAALVKLFEASKATNYLTVAVDHKQHHYGITIQKADGKLTPAEQLESLTAELAAEKKRADAAGQELERMRKWFSDNAAMLAAHRIGGCHFADDGLGAEDTDAPTGAESV